MSTDYFFACDKCNSVSPVAFSRQAWGWGNCWPTNAFSFVIKHVRECGIEYIKCTSEDGYFGSKEDNDLDEYKEMLRGFEER